MLAFIFQNPQSAIPKGTFLAIVITSIVYLLMAWSAGGCMLRDAFGPISSLVITNVTNATAQPPHLEGIHCDALNMTCKYGLQNNNGVSCASFSNYLYCTVLSFRQYEPIYDIRPGGFRI